MTQHMNKSFCNRHVTPMALKFYMKNERCLKIYRFLPSKHNATNSAHNRLKLSPGARRRHDFSSTLHVSCNNTKQETLRMN